MTTKKRVTQNQIDQAVNDAIEQYKSGVNSLQTFRAGKLSLPHLPTPVFKLELCTNMVSELVSKIQEVALVYGELEVMQYGSGFESTLTRQPTGYTKGNIYFKKSPEMIEEDIKIVSKQAEESLRAEIEAYNVALIQAEHDELAELERIEQEEIEAIKQAEIEREERAKRKEQLRERLGVA